MVEGIAIAILISAGVTGGFSLWSILQSKAQVSKQLETQNKIASANLIMHLHEPWRKNEDFKKFLRDMNDDKITEYEKRDVGTLLNKFDEIAAFWADGTLHDEHIKQYFGPNLRKIQSDECIQKIMKDSIKKDPKNRYVNLQKMLLVFKDYRS